ncbi:MAG TPA: acireductone synthase [Blastocatellia bacterium]|nr:acireductone synthase [Blastocatellia bacterium]
MTADCLSTRTGAVLLDIEGTTTPISFVYDVLFPYARRRVRSFLTEHISSADVRSDIEGLSDQHAKDSSEGLDPPPLASGPLEDRLESLAAYVQWLIDRDRKVTPLKSLQGKIWEEGYLSGELKSEVFDDVPRALSLWNERGIQVCIYSSGSVLAQKLLFAHTSAGDLTPLIHDYFDTNVGGKRESESYRRITSSLGRPPSDIIFISDVTAELDAARAAGLRTLLCVRPGNHPQPEPLAHPVIHTFDDLFSGEDEKD